MVLGFSNGLWRGFVKNMFDWSNFASAKLVV